MPKIGHKADRSSTDSIRPASLEQSQAKKSRRFNKMKHSEVLGYSRYDLGLDDEPRSSKLKLSESRHSSVLSHLPHHSNRHNSVDDRRSDLPYIERQHQMLDKYHQLQTEQSKPSSNAVTPVKLVESAGQAYGKYSKHSNLIKHGDSLQSQESSLGRNLLMEFQMLAEKYNVTPKLAVATISEELNQPMDSK